jgi:hypothetical protein
MQRSEEPSNPSRWWDHPRQVESCIFTTASFTGAVRMVTVENSLSDDLGEVPIAGPPPWVHFHVPCPQLVVRTTGSKEARS